MVGDVAQLSEYWNLVGYVNEEACGSQEEQIAQGVGCEPVSGVAALHQLAGQSESGHYTEYHAAIKEQDLKPGEVFACGILDQVVVHVNKSQQNP